MALTLISKNTRLLGLSLLVAAGCASSSTSNTARTSIEQLLIANAVDHSLDKVDFTYFAGSKVFLQEKYVDCTDKNYVIASTRHRLLTSGALLVDAADKADVVIEMRTGAVGTTSASSFLGTPEIALPGMLTVPEIKVAERRKQQAVAKIGLVAIDPKTNAILGTGGTSLSASNDDNWFFAGVGPYQSGTVKKEIHNSTTGAAGQPRGHIPTSVAFSRPEVQGTQYASSPAATSEIKPASHDAEEGAAWSKPPAK